MCRAKRKRAAAQTWQPIPPKPPTSCPNRLIDNMGIEDKKSPGLVDALFARIQRRVLGILFSQPNRSVPATELTSLADIGTGAAHGELTRLTRRGW